MSAHKQPTVFVLEASVSMQLATHVGSNPDGDPLWCSRFLHTNPEGVFKTHLDFLRAGTDIIMTNTYQASVPGFVRYLGVTPEEGYDLITLAVDIAKRARDTYNQECQKNNKPLRNIQISGCIGPYGAYLHDGSEYDGSYADKVSAEELREWHAPRFKALVAAGVDLLAFPTIPCQKEAEVVIEMMKEYPQMKGYLSFSCKDENSLVNGQDFKTVVKTCYDLNPGQLVAVGVNCCPPSIVAKLFKGINDGRQRKIPFVAYPHSGEKYTPEEGWVGREKCVSLSTFVHEWLELGITYIGGCCRTYHTEITAIKELVKTWLKNTATCEDE